MKSKIMVNSSGNSTIYKKPILLNTNSETSNIDLKLLVSKPLSDLAKLA